MKIDNYYDILWHTNKYALEKEVINRLNMGYTLVGGISVTNEGFYQAVTKAVNNHYDSSDEF